MDNQTEHSNFSAAIATGAAMTANLGLVELADRHAVVIPEGYKLAPLEPLMDHPHDFSGHYKTHDVAAMEAFIDAYASDLTRVFVEPDEMAATTIFSFGEPHEPSWRKFRATLSLREAPEFEAIRALHGRAHKQREILDFIADWHPLLSFAGEDGQAMTPAVATQRLQKLDSTTALTATAEETDTAQARSLSERRSLTSSPPTTMTLTTPLYLGMTPRTLAARLVYVADKEPVIKLRITGLDQARLDIAREFSERLQSCSALRESGGIVFIGSFAG